MKSTTTYLTRIIIVLFVLSQLVSFTSIIEIPPSDSIKLEKKNNETFIHLFQDINFTLNKTTIEDNCKQQLFLVIHYLKKNKNVKIEIGVHNDFRTGEDLSQTRADILKNFFEKYGVSSDNIIAKGFHTNNFINDCSKNKKCTQAEHSANRRVEIKVLNPNVIEDFIIVAN